MKTNATFRRTAALAGVAAFLLAAASAHAASVPSLRDALPSAPVVLAAPLAADFQ